MVATNALVGAWVIFGPPNQMVAVNDRKDAALPQALSTRES